MSRSAPQVAAGLWLALWLSPVRHALEHDMALHMTVQLPLLALVGILLAPALRPAEPRWLAEADWLGIPGIALVFFASSVWMLPRALDAALADSGIDLVKFVTVPLLVGLAGASSWRRMPALGRGFVLANIISKLGVLGGLYLAAPVRLCAYYRPDQQAATGRALLAVAAAASLLWLIAALCGWPRPPSPAAARQKKACDLNILPL